MNEKDESKKEIEIFNEVRNVRLQLMDEIQDVIDRYYPELLKKNAHGISGLEAIDVIASLELIKLNLYCEQKREMLARTCRW